MHYKRIGAETEGRHSADDIFKFMFLHKFCSFLMQLLLQFIPSYLIDNKSTLVSIKARQ